MNNSLHIIPVGVYLRIYAVLMVLLITTTALDFLRLGALSIIIALTIAVVKASLVALYFMHVKYTARVNWLYVGAGFFWLLILIGGTLGDYLTRALAATPR